jgi:hypothetical protein
MKHITVTSKIRPVKAVETCCPWWMDIVDKVACLVDPELDKCPELG